MVATNGRTIVGPFDNERTAVITVAIPAGGELPIDPTWRFVGWLEATHEHGHQIDLTVATTPRIVVEGEPDVG